MPITVAWHAASFPTLASGAGSLSMLAWQPFALKLGNGNVTVKPQGVDGQWTKTIKPRPNEIDKWTHWLHGPDGNAVAQDTVVGPPRQMQWIAKPYWSRHHHTVPSVSGFVSSGGRVFYIVDEAPGGMDGSAPDKWSLVARDAFNGLPLWRRPMPEWGWKTWSDDWKCRFTVPTHISRRLVAVGERVYVTLGFNAPLVELDAATGEILRTFDGTELTDEILYSDGLLILSLNQAFQRPGSESAGLRGEPEDPPVAKWVAAVKVRSGELLWKTGDYVGLRSKTGSMERISHLSMCTGDGRVFFVDRDQIVSLSLVDGRELWRAPRPESPEYRARYDIRISDMCSLVYQKGVLFLTQTNPAEKRLGWKGERGRLHAFSASTGKELWHRECSSWGWGIRPTCSLSTGSSGYTISRLRSSWEWIRRPARFGERSPTSRPSTTAIITAATGTRPPRSS